MGTAECEVCGVCVPTARVALHPDGAGYQPCDEAVVEVLLAPMQWAVCCLAGGWAQELHIILADCRSILPRLCSTSRSVS